MGGMMGMMLAGGSSPPQASASNVNGLGIAPPNTQIVSTNNTSLTVTGGQGPFTYLWTYVSGALEANPNSTTIANPFWQGTISLGTYVSTWRCTVTDALGRTATTDITVTLELTN